MAKTRVGSRKRPRVVDIHDHVAEQIPNLDLKALVDKAYVLIDNAKFNLGVGLTLIEEARKRLQ